MGIEGCWWTVTTTTNYTTCPDCHGCGTDPYAMDPTCHTCHGTGEIIEYSEEDEDE